MRALEAAARFLLLTALAILAGCGPREARRGTTPSPRAHDQVAIELVESAPLGTTLDHPDVPNAADVWVAMIDAARQTIDFAEFYASEAEPKDRATSKLATVIAAVERAVKRGVHVRFLADSVFAPKYPETLERLERLGAVVRIIDFGARGGGILHAKFFVVDDVEAFVGSQNFDWRALDHIQEMGVHVTSSVIAGALLDILDTDWELATGRGAANARVHRHARADVKARTGESVSLVASPRGWLPDEASWELPRLVALLDGSTRTIDLQVLTYKTKERNGSPFPTLDDALRRAAQRGVHVRLLVSEWSSKAGSEARLVLEELAKVPNVEVRVIVIPRWSGGEIPFARVAHAKYLVVDAARAWVGTSNWEGDYFTKSRNVGVVVEGGKLPARLDGVFVDGWTSGYASALSASALSPGSAAPPSSSGPARP